MQAAINKYKVERLIEEAARHGCRYIAIKRIDNSWTYSQCRGDIDKTHHRFYSRPDIEHKDSYLVMGNLLFNKLRNDGLITLIEITKNKNYESKNFLWSSKNRKN